MAWFELHPAAGHNHFFRGDNIAAAIIVITPIQYKVRCRAMATSWIVTGAGIVVSLLGYYLMPSVWGYGVLGFGLAHILLGVLDMFRAPARVRF